MSKNVAFVFALPVRTYPILITMPFGLNVITLLDKKGYNIDIYLSEYKNSSYNNLFSENVKIHFVDKNYLWRNNVSLAFFMITNYFKLLSCFKLKNSYSLIFGSGMAGVTIGAILKRFNPKSKFIYLNDEFPIQDTDSIWVESELKSALSADLVSTPDETRYVPLCNQIPGLNKIPHFTLPNTPLKDEINTIPSINWHERFDIPEDKKIFLMAGGMNDFCQLPELLTSVKNWPDNTVLLLKGKQDINNIRRSLKHIDIPAKIVWSGESFTPDELHSLIKYCTASICLYTDVNDNFRYVGKSAGKLMRSVLLGKPVIVSNSESFQFVEDFGFGKMVTHSTEIPSAIQYILDNEKELGDNCKKNYQEISYEKYWGVFEKILHTDPAV